MSATDEIRRLLDERGINYINVESIDGSYWGIRWFVGDNIGVEWRENGKRHELLAVNITPEQAIAATLGSDASAIRLADRLRNIADEMRTVGASSMTTHELLVCYASDVDKVAGLLTFAATLGGGDDSSRYSKLFGTPERAARTLRRFCADCFCGDCATCGVPEWANYTRDYDALLEWLRGDA